MEKKFPATGRVGGPDQGPLVRNASHEGDDARGKAEEADDGPQQGRGEEGQFGHVSSEPGCRDQRQPHHPHFGVAGHSEDPPRLRADSPRACGFRQVWSSHLPGAVGGTQRLCPMFRPMPRTRMPIGVSSGWPVGFVNVKVSQR